MGDRDLKGFHAMIEAVGFTGPQEVGIFSTRHILVLQQQSPLGTNRSDWLLQSVGGLRDAHNSVETVHRLGVSWMRFKWDRRRTMRKAPLMAAFLVSFVVAACAASPLLDHAGDEPAIVERGTIVVGKTISESFEISLHQDKQKAKVEPTLTTAMNLRLRRGFMSGAAGSASSSAVFQEALTKFLEDRKGRGCQTSNPLEIQSLVWEFDYSCPKEATPARVR